MELYEVLGVIEENQKYFIEKINNTEVEVFNGCYINADWTTDENGFLDNITICLDDISLENCEVTKMTVFDNVLYFELEVNEYDALDDLECLY